MLIYCPRPDDDLSKQIHRFNWSLEGESMEPRMELGDYLVAYLKKIGVSHLFGIPGDLVINLFLKFGRRKGLKIITLSHEPAQSARICSLCLPGVTRS
jgi:Thiamine pyrophosphate enzyme, N-terminal TPP binding domain